MENNLYLPDANSTICLLILLLVFVVYILSVDLSVIFNKNYKLTSSWSSFIKEKYNNFKVYSLIKVALNSINLIILGYATIKTIRLGHEAYFSSYSALILIAVFAIGGIVDWVFEKKTK